MREKRDKSLTETHPVVVHCFEDFIGLSLGPNIGKSNEPVILDGLVALHPLVQLDPLVVVGIAPGSTAVCQSQPQVRYRIVHEDPHHQGRDSPILAKASNIVA